MRRERNCVRGGAVLAAVGAIALVAQTSSGVDIGPSFGTVELRWRERSTAGYNGSYVLGPGATAGVDAFPTPDPTAQAVLNQDATVVLVLEARVTAAAGMPGNAIRGLRAATLDIATNQTSGGAFARQTVMDQVPGVNPRANARVTSLNLGITPSTLVNHPTSGAPRGVVSPFRQLAQNPSINGPGVGSFRDGDVNRIYKATPVLEISSLDPASADATHPGQYENAGLDAWVPLYIAIYTITDVTTERDIVFSVLNTPQSGGFPTSTDFDFRTWRGSPNPLLDNLDMWQLMPAFTTAPTFTVHVVPGPGAVGLVAVGGLVAPRRRRR